MALRGKLLVDDAPTHRRETGTGDLPGVLGAPPSRELSEGKGSTAEREAGAGAAIRGHDRVSGLFGEPKWGSRMKKCNAIDDTLWASTVTPGMLQLDRLWTKKPGAVSLDFSVSSDACRLYDVLAIENYKKAYRTNLVTIRTRDVGALFKKSPMTISRWLRQLSDAGHVEKLSGHGQVATYRLLSRHHEYHAKVDTMPGVSATVPSRDLAVVRDKKRKCLKCGKVRRIASSSGACDVCLEEWAQRKTSA